MRRSFLLLMAALSLSLVYACGKDNPASPVDAEGAAAEARAGDEALAAGDFAGANTRYKNALNKDPNNAQANVGAAVTELYLVQNDPQVDSLIQIIRGQVPLPRPNRATGLESTRAPNVLRQLGLSGHGNFDPISTGSIVTHALLRGAEDPPLLSRVQALVRVKLLPKLQYIENRLNLVEAHPTWRFLLPPVVTDAPDTLELDLGEVYALDAVVNGVQGWLGILVAYNFDVPAPADSVPLDSLLAPGTDFGKIWADGGAQLSAARTNFLASKTRIDQMVAFINAETDDQADDVIPDEALVEPGFLEFMQQFNQVQTSLSSPVEVEINDYQGQPVTIQVQIGSFFTNPIQDWKTKLPTHSFVNHEPVISDPITFPDPAFNGIYPGMTNEEWRAIIGPVGPPALARARR